MLCLNGARVASVVPLLVVDLDLVVGEVAANTPMTLTMRTAAFHSIRCHFDDVSYWYYLVYKWG